MDRLAALKKSDIIFFGTAFFIISWFVGYVMGLKTMFLSWGVWLLIFVFIKFLERFD